MIKLNELNRLAYFADTEHELLGNTSEYHMFLNGRLAFKIFVQTEDEQVIDKASHKNCFPVWVARPGGENAAIKIDKAHAARKFDQEKGAQRISSDSVKYAVLPQLPWILTELYVPAN